MSIEIQQIRERLKSSLIDISQTKITDAAILVAITQEQEPKVLLTRRAQHMKSHAGEVSFPGGRYESQDINNVSTALRETNEETSLCIDDVDVIGQLPEQVSKSGLSVRPIVGIISPNQSLLASDEEIARIFWVPLSWFVNLPTKDYEVISKFNDKEDVKIQTPSWQFEDEIIWGLTGKIVASLLNICFDKKVRWYYKLITE